MVMAPSRHEVPKSCLVTSSATNQMWSEFLPDDSERDNRGTLKAWPAWLQEGRPSPTGRLTFTTWRLWKKNSPLRESGLLGPVALHAVVELSGYSGAD